MFTNDHSILEGDSGLANLPENAEPFFTPQHLYSSKNIVNNDIGTYFPDAGYETLLGYNDNDPSNNKIQKLSSSCDAADEPHLKEKENDNENTNSDQSLSLQKQEQVIYDNLDQIVSEIIGKIKDMLSNYRFEEIQKLLNENFPDILETNIPNVFYPLMKLKFFYLIFIGSTHDAKIFYYDYFVHILKKSRKNCNNKEKCFLKLLSMPSILNTQSLIKKNSDIFMLELTRALFKYLAERFRREKRFFITCTSQPDFVQNETATYEGSGRNGMMNLDEIERTEVMTKGESSTHQMPNSFTLPNSNEEGICSINQSSEIQDLSQLSTKEEFSDYEDEIQGYEACTDNLQNISGPQVKINNEFLKFVNNQYASPSVNSGSNDFNANQRNFLKNDPSSNFKVHSKIILPRPQKPVDSLRKKLPLLNHFKPQYTKKENIDKKIIRRFKQHLKEEYRAKAINLERTDKHFWLMFINGNLFPPLNFFDNNTQEHIEFKSLNSKYFLWLFSKVGAKELYENFIQITGNSFLCDLMRDYKIPSEMERKQLENYMNNLPYIYDISILNGETNLEMFNSSTGSAAFQKPNPFDLDMDVPVGSSVKNENSQDYTEVRMLRRHERSRELEFDNSGRLYPQSRVGESSDDSDNEE